MVQLHPPSPVRSRSRANRGAAAARCWKTAQHPLHARRTFSFLWNENRRTPGPPGEEDELLRAVKAFQDVQQGLINTPNPPFAAGTDLCAKIKKWGSGDMFARG